MSCLRHGVSPVAPKQQLEWLKHSWSARKEVKTECFMLSFENTKKQ